VQLVVYSVVYSWSVQAHWGSHWRIASSPGRRLWHILWCSDTD